MTNIKICTGIFVLSLLAACGGSEMQPPQADVVAAPEAAAPAAPQFANVNTERLLAADNEPGQWMSTGRTYGEQHYSPLTAISRDNVSQLGLRWFVDFNIPRGQESTPLVVDGVIYVTTAWSNVRAYDAATGATLWEFDSEVPREWVTSSLHKMYGGPRVKLMIANPF